MGGSSFAMSAAIARLGAQSGALKRGFHSTSKAQAGNGLWKTYGFSPVKVWVQLGELTKSRLLQSNVGVEKYAAFREDIESAFRTDNRTTIRLGIFAAAIPLAIYAATVAEFEDTDRAYGHDDGLTTRGGKKEYMQ